MDDMIMTIAAWLAKIGIGTIATKLAAAYEAKQNAETRQEEIAANERIKALEARRDVMVAEGHMPINAAFRAFIAFGPALYLFKIFVLDKVVCPPLGLACRTDPLTPELWTVVTAVIGFYFLAEGAAMTARIVKRKE
jgi:hypothetical protein